MRGNNDKQIDKCLAVHFQSNDIQDAYLSPGADET